MLICSKVLLKTMTNTKPNTTVLAKMPPHSNDNSNADPPPVDLANAAVAADADALCDVQVGVPEDVCQAMAVYQQENCLLRSLVVMSHGLLTEFNLEVHPWNTLKQKKWALTNKQLVQEILRHWTDYAWENRLNERAPRPNQWKTPQLMEWLTQHPVMLQDDGSTTAATDESFLKGEIARYKHRLLASIQEQAEETELLDGNWQGFAPICCLTHCLVDFDEHKHKFLAHHDAMDQSALDYRNSNKSRQLTMWDFVANKWNDVEFAPTTEALPEDHPFHYPTFATPIELSHSLVARMSKATPSKCEAKFASLVVLMKRIRSNFKRSREGERDILDGDFDLDEFSVGTNSDAEPEGGHCRMDFVKDKQAYIIYMWYQLEHHDLMRSSIQELDSWLAPLHAADGVGRLFDLSDNGYDNSSVRTSASKSSRGSDDFGTFSTSINNLGSSSEREAA